jgi:MFS family permease
MSSSAHEPLLPPTADAAAAAAAPVTAAAAAPGDDRSPWGVLLAVVLTALGPVSFGYVLGYSSPTAEALVASGLLTPAGLNIFEALSPLGAILGAGAAGVAADAFGRSRALALTCAPFAVGWLLIAAAQVWPSRGACVCMCCTRACCVAWRARRALRRAKRFQNLTAHAPSCGFVRCQRARATPTQSASMLYAGRLLTGVGVGCVLNIVPVYVAEIAPQKCAPVSRAPRPASVSAHAKTRGRRLCVALPLRLARARAAPRAPRHTPRPFPARRLPTTHGAARHHSH